MSARLLSRALLAVLLMVALGSAESVENRYQPQPASKASRGGTRRGKSQRSLRQRRAFRATTSADIRHCTATGPEELPAPCLCISKSHFPSTDVPAANRHEEIRARMESARRKSTIGREPVPEGLRFRFPDLPKPPPVPLPIQG